MSARSPLVTTTDHAEPCPGPDGTTVMQNNHKGIRGQGRGTQIRSATVRRRFGGEPEDLGVKPPTAAGQPSRPNPTANLAGVPEGYLYRARTQFEPGRRVPSAPAASHCPWVSASAPANWSPPPAAAAAATVVTAAAAATGQAEDEQLGDTERSSRARPSRSPTKLIDPKTGKAVTKG